MSLPRSTALGQARALLAAIEQAAHQPDSSDWARAVTNAEAAIAVLERCECPADAEVRRLLATAWLKRGQLHESAATTVQALDHAIAAYDRAIASLREVADPDEHELQRELAVAWMNRGNARQKQGGAENLLDALRSYDTAIELLQPLPFADNPTLRSTLGAAWLNRGAAWERLIATDAAAMANARHSFDQAIAALEPLPLSDNPNFRVNLAGAWMNRGHLLTQTGSLGDTRAAREASKNALRVIAPLEETHATAAEIGLKARNVLCRAIGLLLSPGQPPAPSNPPAPAPDDPAMDPTILFDEATDAVDAALQSARRWKLQDNERFRPLRAELFRFGALIYRIHQPHFLAEFVLENVDPENHEPPTAIDPALLAIAREVIADAVSYYERPRILTADMTGLERHTDTLRDLRAAAERLTALAQMQSAQA